MSKRETTKGRALEGPIFELEDSKGLFSDLIATKTGVNRKETIESIKKNLASWMGKEDFNRFRSKRLDLAIVARVNKQRMEQQDVDNIAKVVLDALRRNDKTGLKRNVFLFYDDSQVVRLLVYKIPRKEDETCDTDGLDISFRVHDHKKEMKLRQVNQI